MLTRSSLKAAKLACAGLAAVALGGCPTAGLDVRVYYLEPDQGGLVRRQESEYLTWEQARGYRCMSPKDFDATVEFIRSCMDARP